MTDNIEFWNQRAALGATSGTQDLIAVELERRAIEKHVKDGMRVLDVGCGDGQTALRLANDHRIDLIGIDNAEEMIVVARGATVYLGNGAYVGPEAEDKRSEVQFLVKDVLHAKFHPVFDLIYTQRCIINLPDWPTQRNAIERILSWLKPGGKFLMVECSQDGLDGINKLRALVGLSAIVQPWHCRYLRDAEIDDLISDLDSEDIIVDPWDPQAIASTYALLSRVVNAKLAQDAGVEPVYDSPINRLALSLPNVGELGQNRMWMWQRQGGE